MVKKEGEPFVVKIGVDRRVGELYIGPINNADAIASKEKRMFTAEMVLDLVKSARKTCKGLDEWIERDVVSHFKNTLRFRCKLPKWLCKLKRGQTRSS